MTRLVLSLALMLGAVAVTTAPVSASISLRISPSLVELRAKPGGRGTQDITVSNQGNEPVAVSVAIEPVGPSYLSAVEWLDVETASFELDPEEQESIAVKIVVPDGLESGGRYALVTITAGALEEQDAEPRNRAALAAQVAVGFMIVVEGIGPLIRDVAIERFAPVLEADGRIGFRALVRNLGNVHLQSLNARVELRRADGNRLGSLEFKETTPILPGSQRELATQGSLPLQPGAAYQGLATIVPDEEDEQRIVESTAEFVVRPSLTLASAAVCENLDKGPTLQVELLNDGELGLGPGVQFLIQDSAGNPLGTTSPLEAPLIWPGERVSVSIDFPQRLESGDYLLVIQATLGPLDPQQLEAPFRIGGLEGGVPLCAMAAGSSAMA